MLEVGADVNAVGYGGLWGGYRGTPLHEAAYVDSSTEIIQMLIDNGARKDVKDVQGLTPGSPATHRGQFSWARYGQNLLRFSHGGIKRPSGGQKKWQIFSKKNFDLAETTEITTITS